MKSSMIYGMFIGLGIVLGGLAVTYLQTPAANAAMADDDARATREFMDNVRDIKVQVAEINDLMKSGKLLVVVAINPDAENR